MAGLLGPMARANAPGIPFNIPAGEFSQAIIEFSKQSQLEILYASIGSVGNVKTHAVVGELGVSEALAKMLKGTGFTFEFENARSVLLKRVEANSAQAGAVGVLGPQRRGDAHTQQLGMAADPAEDARADTQEVVVTGSFIHGLKDIVSPLVVVAEKEKKQAAYGTVQEMLRILPANYGGGPAEDFSNSANFSRGSSVNLRGLGSGATLVLVNGRRQPVSGVDGDFVDVSTIPWSAVERIEVLPDGASALYGSDAIAGVVNIIMRTDLSGMETQTRFGVGTQGADETLVAQLFGHHWDRGKWLVTYQYSERASLAMADRAYSASADKTPFGGTDLRTFLSNPGNILNPLTQRPAFAIPNAQDGKSLTLADLRSDVVNLQNELEGRDLLPFRRTHNVFLTASQQIGAHSELFAEGRYSDRRMVAKDRPYSQLLAVPDTNPFFIDPFGGSPFVLVAYNFLKDFGPLESVGETETYTATLGVRADLGRQWQATLAGFNGVERMHWTGANLADFGALNAALADPDPATAFNPFGSGSNTNPATLDAIRAVQGEGALSNIKTVNLLVDGPLLDLPTGPVKLAVGLDNRRESFSRKESFNDEVASSRYGRSTKAAFAELAMPIALRLDLSLAARYEAYSDFGTTFNPKIGLRWTPIESLRLRSSWGSSFRAPTLVDVYDRTQDFAALLPIADLRSAAGQSIIGLVWSGTNSSLREETATTWTAGIDLAPEALSGFTLSSTYYVIDYEGRIWRPQAPLTLEAILANDQWASLVTRNPLQSDFNAICSSPIFFGSPSDCATNPPAAILDIRVRNLTATTVKGLDIDLKQALRTAHGSYSFGLAGSYLFSFEQAVTQIAPVIDLANSVGNPSALRIRGTAEWYEHGRNQPGFGASMAVDYHNRSRDDENLSVTGVASSATLDLQLNYRTVKTDDWRGGVEFTLNAVNVLNEDPPFVNRILGYDPVNSSPFGRVISFSVQKGW